MKHIFTMLNSSDHDLEKIGNLIRLSDRKSLKNEDRDRVQANDDMRAENVGRILDRVQADSIRKKMGLQGSPIDNFDTSRLGKILTHGGSSIVYSYDDNTVIKEQLPASSQKAVNGRSINKAVMADIDTSEAALTQEARKDIKVEADEVARKYKNNLAVCQHYLGDFLLKTSVSVKPNRNNVDSVYAMQMKLPSDHQTLHPDGWDFTFGDQDRAGLRNLLDAIQHMYHETGLMVDVLTLSNIAYSPSRHQFYLYDIDPLICDSDNLEKLSRDFNADSSINGDFVTYSENKTDNAMEVNMDHLQLLQNLLMSDHGTSI